MFVNTISPISYLCKNMKRTFAKYNNIARSKCDNYVAKYNSYKTHIIHLCWLLHLFFNKFSSISFFEFKVSHSVLLQDFLFNNFFLFFFLYLNSNVFNVYFFCFKKYFLILRFFSLKKIYFDLCFFVESYIKINSIKNLFKTNF